MTERLKDYITKLVPLCDIKKEENRKELFKKILLGKMPAGQVMFTTSRENPFTYYLLDGEVKLTHITGKQDILRSDDPRCRFPIGSNLSQNYTVKTVTDISYLKIDTETLDVLLTWDQVTTPFLKHPVKNTNDNEVNWMSRILELELFQRIPPVNIQAMFLKFESIELQKDDIVIAQGAAGDYYYVIKSGRCAIYRSDTPEQTPLQHKLAELGPGDSFGEEALVSDNPRNATVVMRESGELARLSKEDFLTLLKDPIMRTVSYAEAQEMIDQGARFIDIRTVNEYQHNRLENSLNLPLDRLRDELVNLDKDTLYIVYCDSSARSAAGCYLMNQRGFTAFLLENGLKSVPSEVILLSDQN